MRSRRAGWLGAMTAVSVVLLAAVLLFRATPETPVRWALALLRWRAGFRSAIAVTDSGAVPYFDGGRGPVIVLLHGFQDSRNSWVPVGERLTATHRVIIPDLYGFGENHAHTNGDYRPMAQAARVRAFLVALGIDTVDIGGVSMGGEIAAAFAAAYPDITHSVALISTAGASSDTIAPVGQRLLAGDDVFHVETERQLDTLIRLIVDSGMTIPPIAKPAILSEYRRRNPEWDSIFAQLAEPATRTLVDSLATSLRMPTLILWGAHDPIFHRSTAVDLGRRIIGATVVVLQDCGHLCPASRPDDVAAAYRRFLDATAGIVRR